MKIRAATPADATAVADLATQLGYPISPEEAEARLRDLETRPENAVLAAEADGVVVGWIQVAGAHRVDSEPYAEIAALVVDVACRGGGIGTELVAAADERLGFARTKSQVVFARPISRR